MVCPWQAFPFESKVLGQGYCNTFLALGLPRTNTPAYFGGVSETKKKRFITFPTDTKSELFQPLKYVDKQLLLS
jgi:hypothetical protein